jgi:hypothetical protein
MRSLPPYDVTEQPHIEPVDRTLDTALRRKVG